MGERHRLNILWVGDLVVESGFGRISNAICQRLMQRGHLVVGVGIQYGGWPHGLGFHVWPTAGLDIWATATEVANSLRFGPNNTRPDVVVCCQDYPYSVSLFRDCRIDWEHMRQVIVTPIDGEPVFDEWVEISRFTDATMVISEFGVEALRRCGVHAYLCPPGVDSQRFRPFTEAERGHLRGRAGIPVDAFVVGMAAMNQGRKNVPATMEAFREFAADKPKALLLLDMEKAGPGGWKLTKLGPQDARGLQQEIGLRDDQVLYRPDMAAKGLLDLRERFGLMDVHGVLSYREGFGLPLIEGMACGIPSFALDWCAGTEVMSEGRGVLVPRQPEMRYGTWGNAQDADPDISSLVKALNRLYYDRPERERMAEAGRLWAAQRTWDKAADAVEAVLRQVVEQRQDYLTEIVAGARDGIAASAAFGHGVAGVR